MAGHVVELFRQPKLAAALGAAGRQHVVANWSLERMVEGYEDLLCDLYRRKTAKNRSLAVSGWFRQFFAMLQSRCKQRKVRPTFPAGKASSVVVIFSTLTVLRADKPYGTSESDRPWRRGFLRGTRRFDRNFQGGSGCESLNSPLIVGLTIAGFSATGTCRTCSGACGDSCGCRSSCSCGQPCSCQSCSGESGLLLRRTLPLPLWLVSLLLVPELVPLDPLRAMQGRRRTVW